MCCCGRRQIILRNLEKQQVQRGKYVFSPSPFLTPSAAPSDVSSSDTLTDWDVKTVISVRLHQPPHPHLLHSSRKGTQPFKDVVKGSYSVPLPLRGSPEEELGELQEEVRRRLSVHFQITSHLSPEQKQKKKQNASAYSWKPAMKAAWRHLKRL